MLRKPSTGKALCFASRGNWGAETATVATNKDDQMAICFWIWAGRLYHRVDTLRTMWLRVKKLPRDWFIQERSDQFLGRWDWIGPFVAVHPNLSLVCLVCHICYTCIFYNVCPVRHAFTVCGGYSVYSVMRWRKQFCNCFDSMEYLVPWYDAWHANASNRTQSNARSWKWMEEIQIVCHAEIASCFAILDPCPLEVLEENRGRKDDLHQKLQPPQAQNFPHPLAHVLVRGVVFFVAACSDPENCYLADPEHCYLAAWPGWGIGEKVDRRPLECTHPQQRSRWYDIGLQ